MTNSIEQRLAEAFDALWDRFVDPRDAYAGDGDEPWAPVGHESGSGGGLTLPLLERLRDESRRLALTNEFAINGLENRVSYVVGTGHVYHATPRKGCDAPRGWAAMVQEVIDEFLVANSWHSRQQEAMRRLDRDGEAFLRLFAQPDGMTLVRFVEPECVATPAEAAANPAASHGVLTDVGDVETALGYYIDGRLVDGAEVQHRKANVDRNAKRGLPLLTPVRKNLRRAEKLLRNMSVVAEIQSAIALIRKHRSASRSGVERFVADRSSGETIDSQGRTRRVTEYGPGTILDAPAGLEYDFPATRVDAGSYVTILQAELRAVAARLVMPEFMFTSDASNANFASTMVAEGPAVKMFERLQAAMIEEDQRVLAAVLRNAVIAGRLPADAPRVIEVQATAPSISVRDRLQEARIDEIAHRRGLLSPQSWSRRLGLDYDQEQENCRTHDTRPSAAGGPVS
ncbi:MAG: phage portal protein [Lacipirellulaceae bacterium]